MMMAWCHGCNRVVLPKDKRCPLCGSAFEASAGGDYFVSGTATRSPSVVEIPVDAVLFDRFRIAKRLGGGSSGTVYLAHDQLTGVQVALKMGEILGECCTVQRLVHEQRIRQKIRDFEHVLRALDVHTGSWGGSEILAVALEYADGGTLRDWLHSHAGDTFARAQNGLELLKQGMRGLAELHDAGIVHLDPKPENLLMVVGTVKVGDLAAAVCHDRREWSGQMALELEPRTTGTPEYMAPEQFDAVDLSSVDVRCNVYSVGVMLYELLHPGCRRPFDGPAESLRQFHRSTAPSPLAGVDARIASIVTRCLEKAPDARFQTVREVLTALDGPHDLTRAGDRTNVGQVHEDRPRFEEAVAGFECAWDAFARGELSEAHRICRRILVQDTQHEKAAELVQEIERRDREAQAVYQRLAGGFDALGLNEVGALLQAAEEIYPNHPGGASFRPSFVIRCEQYGKAVEDILAAFRSGAPEAAVPPLRRAAMLNPGESAVEQLMDFVASAADCHEQTQQGIQQALTSGEYERALALAASLDSFSDAVSGRFLQGEE